jgi:predicted restriction endonuclease
LQKKFGSSYESEEILSKKQIREHFRTEVFKRDHYKCVICKEKAEDVHHIMDRSLFSDGGYVVDNGVSLCSEDHKKAEKGEISCDHLRQKAGIIYTVLPLGFDSGKKYDKWGNVVKQK